MANKQPIPDLVDLQPIGAIHSGIASPNLSSGGGDAAPC